MSPTAAFTLTNEPLAPELEQVFLAHGQLVYRTAYSVTGSAQDAEDVVQTLFLQLLRRGFPPGFGNNPQGYLYRAAVNLSLNTVKSRRRLAAVAEDAQVAFGAGLVEAGASNSESELQERLVNAIAQLSPRAVEMLILRYEHDHSEADIARLLGTSRGVVAVTLFRARRRLKKLLRSSSARPANESGEQS